MSHSQTPPVVPALPVEDVRELILLAEAHDRVPPKLQAWVKATDQRAAWQVEENKRLAFIQAVHDSINSYGGIEESEIRSLYERTLKEAQGQ